MMIWTDSNLRAVELHLRELRAQAAQDRLACQARRARPWRPPHRWRRRLGMALIAAGEALAGQALDLTCQPHHAP
jgi:hypothetical protein